MREFRLIHLGVAGLVAAAGVIGVTQLVGAAGGGVGAPSVLVPITPCRLLDTRTGAENVGTRSKPLGAAESATFQVTGTNGKCTIPSNATGIAANVTAVNPTAASYVTIFPADAPRPTASNLNVIANSPPTPNQVTVGLSATGAIGAYNNGGTLDLIVDIVGYYQAEATATTVTTMTTTPQATTHQIYFSGLDSGFQYNNLVGGAVYNSNDCITFSAADQTAFMPLDLPIGASVTAIQVHYVDKSPGGIIMTLFAGEPGISTASIGELVSIGTNAVDYHRSDSFTITTPLAVTVQSTYSIKVFSQAGTGAGDASVSFCGAVVDYTLPGS